MNWSGVLLRSAMLEGFMTAAPQGLAASSLGMACHQGAVAGVRSNWPHYLDVPASDLPTSRLNIYLFLGFQHITKIRNFFFEDRLSSNLYSRFSQHSKSSMLCLKYCRSRYILLLSERGQLFLL